MYGSLKKIVSQFQNLHFFTLTKGMRAIYRFQTIWMLQFFVLNIEEIAQSSMIAGFF